MGGSCISRPKKQRNNSAKYVQNSQQKGQIRSMHTQLSVHFPEFQINYPHFQSSWRLISEVQAKTDFTLTQIKNKIKTIVCTNANASNFLPIKCYSYFGEDKQKYFTVLSKQNLKKDTKEWKLEQPSVRSYFLQTASLFECVVFKNFILQLQICPESELVLIQKNCIRNLNEDMQFHFPSPKLVYISLAQDGQLAMSAITQEEIKNKIPNFKSYKQKGLDKNCLINGIALVDHSKNKQALSRKSSKQKHGFTKLRDIFVQLNQMQQVDGILCYINPSIAKTWQKQQKQNMKFSPATYLQFKAQVELPHLKMHKLFTPNTILIDCKPQMPCIYLLIFALKLYMQTHPQLKQAPLLFLQQLLTMNKGTHQLLTQIISIIKIIYILVANSSESNHKPLGNQVDNCCRNILQISLVNSHLLIDAYLIQFSIQLNERSLPIRQNPLLQPTAPMKFRFIPSLKHNLYLIQQIKTSSDKHLKKIVALYHHAQDRRQQTEKQIENQFNIWLQRNLDLFQNANYGVKNRNFVQSLREKENDLNVQDPSINIVISLQSYFTVKLIKFVVKTFLMGLNLFQIDSPFDRSKINSVIKSWKQIVNPFMNNNLNFCSGEAAITILTFDGMIKCIQGVSSVQDCQNTILKALQIWLRIYRDPRAKYQPFLSNNWIALLIRILATLKSKKQKSLQNDQDAFYLANILQCCNSNSESKFSSVLEQTILSIPLLGISGILYNKQQLFLPAEEQSTLLMRTGSSLFENMNDNLSSKSNFSDSLSNTNSQLGKKKRKNKKKILDIVHLSESRIFRNGIYQWGKSKNSVPLLHALTKNLDVFKICCSNYHVVIATSAGIFGWGENGSGQLGGQTKQNVKTIKMVLQKYIESQKQIKLSCGNEHTAILFKQKPLVMLGQKEGGIVSGNGHIFDEVSCGGLHTLGLRKGKVYSWGRGEGGQLGHRTEHLKTKIKQESTDFFLDEPKMINGIPNIKKSVCGDAHSVLLGQNGDVFVFGFCYQGQLGLGLTGDSEVFQIFQPFRLDLSELLQKKVQIADIFAGPTFTFFKTTEGEILSCGLNDCCQLGHQKMMKVFQKKKIIYKESSYKNQRIGEVQYSRPKKIQIFSKQINVKEIYCGENHCLASVEYLKKNKMIMGWGLNKQFQISNQFSSDSIAPRTLDNIYDYNFSEVCCGSNFSLGLVKSQNRLGIHQLRFKIEDLLATTVKLNQKFSKQ